jgi:hypothetical protein
MSPLTGRRKLAKIWWALGATAKPAEKHNEANV